MQKRQYEPKPVRQSPHFRQGGRLGWRQPRASLLHCVRPLRAAPVAATGGGHGAGRLLACDRRHRRGDVPEGQRVDGSRIVVREQDERIAPAETGQHVVDGPRLPAPVNRFLQYSRTIS